MTCDATEFIRRFAMHVLPKGFMRIRYFGMLSSTSKATCAVIIREQLPPMESYTKPSKEIYNPLLCPCCKKVTMQTILKFNRRDPLSDWKEKAKEILKMIL